MAKKKYPHKFKLPSKKPTKKRKIPRRRDIPSGVRKTYNIFTTAESLEAFHPQFIGIDKDVISEITENDDVVEIRTKPTNAKVTLFKGRIPLTNVNISKRIKQKTLGKVV